MKDQIGNHCGCGRCGVCQLFHRREVQRAIVRMRDKIRKGMGKATSASTIPKPMKDKRLA